MRKTLLLLLAIHSTGFALSLPDCLSKKTVINYVYHVMDDIKSMIHAHHEDMTNMLQEASTLRTPVINKVLATLLCSKQLHVNHNNILTIIDYSLPSNEKRLWVFDLKEKKLLFHTYVSHGIKTGMLISHSFSNKNDSKCSSVGIYNTEKTYHGRDGLSLRLEGLEKGFNNNAFNRYVVIHGGWYVTEDFIKKYGRPGRSWGCPALPLELTKPIINTIKDKTLLVVYYPHDQWLATSKFLNCKRYTQTQQAAALEAEIIPPTETAERRDDILYADINHNNNREENEPVVVMAAAGYEPIFHVKAPLTRMLRRQINQAEYIALSLTEYKTMLTHNAKILNHDDKNNLSALYFVVPEVKMKGGYFETQMKIISLGRVKDITFRSTNHFIRWLGL